MNPMTHAEALKALFVEGADLDLTDRHAAQYALGLAGRIERTAQELIDSLMDGNDAMRAVADEPPFSEEPFAPISPGPSRLERPRGSRWGIGLWPPKP